MSAVKVSDVQKGKEGKACRMGLCGDMKEGKGSKCRVAGREKLRVWDGYEVNRMGHEKK